MTPGGLYHSDLSSIIRQAGLLRAVRRHDFRPGDTMYVWTENSTYVVRAQQGGEFLVSGGWFARGGPVPVRTTIRGCTWGGKAIKVDVVAACGLRLEFGNRVTTSTIRRIVVVPRHLGN
jgi:hypothetical protein